MGWENVFHCEWNEFGQKILKHYWPQALTYDDITKTDFSIHRGKIDILSGGFPCQPYSVAGKRKGKEDERHLWPEMLRAIRQIQPSYVVGENVGGLVSWNGGMVFNEVQSDLETEGYEVLPFLLPACAKNAPHRRDRVWFIAYNNKCSAGPSGTNSETESNRSKNNDEQKGWRIARKLSAGCDEFLQSITHASSSRQPFTENMGGIKKTRYMGAYGLSGSWIASDTNIELLQRRGDSDRPEETKRHAGSPLCRNAWENFPTQSPICNGDDGIPPRLDCITFPKWRSESIKAGGNAIVPQVAFEIFKAIEQYKKTTKNILTMEDKKIEILKLINEYSVQENSSTLDRVIEQKDFNELADEIAKLFK